jgi:hypothetical protein
MKDKIITGIYIGIYVCAITAYPVVLVVIYNRVLDIGKLLK